MTSIHRTCLLAAACSAVVSLQASATTLAYWQFEDNPSQQNIATSVPDSDLDLVTGTSGGSNNKNSNFVSNGYIGQGLAFDANRADGGSVATFDTNIEARSDAMGVSNFTLETFVNPASLPGDGETVPLIYLGRYSGPRMYLLELAGQSDGAYLQLTYTSNNANTTNVRVLDKLGAAFTSEDTDAWTYVAAVLDSNTGELTLRVGNETESFTGMPVPDSTSGSVTRFVLGGKWVSDGGSAVWADESFDGILDQVRISDEALSENQLLINTIPEPGSLALLLAAGVGLLLPRHRS